MLRDIKVVENAIHQPWSNGVVEGHVNRIKSLKRQMYGRASFELLRRKIILSQHITFPKCDEEPASPEYPVDSFNHSKADFKLKKTSIST